MPPCHRADTTPESRPASVSPAATSSVLTLAARQLGLDWFRENAEVAVYTLNERAFARAQRLIKARQYVLRSEWGNVQPGAAEQNRYLNSHSWEEYEEWHLGLTEGAPDQTKARYAFVYGDFRRLHRSGLIACHYRAAEWRHKEIELAAHELLQVLDQTSG
jgi:hypothetical protein